MSNDVEDPKVGDPQKGIGSTETEATWYNAVVEQLSVYGIAAGYCLSASLLSIINKWAVMKFAHSKGF